MASTIAFYIIDVSPGMAEEVYDEETGRTVSKLDLCKEYVCRKISPKVCSIARLAGRNADWRNHSLDLKIQSGRKTEHAGVLTFGGRKFLLEYPIAWLTNDALPATDNPFFAKSEGDEPEANAHDPQDYVGVASIFPPQQARPQMLGVVQSIQIGDFNGNREWSFSFLQDGTLTAPFLYSNGRSDCSRQDPSTASKSQQIQELEERGGPADSW